MSGFSNSIEKKTYGLKYEREKLLESIILRDI